MLQDASACPPTRGCGGDAVGSWRLVGMCTRAPELSFDSYTHAAGARCRAEIRAADLSAQGTLEVSAALAIELQYALRARLVLVWAAHCLTDAVHCSDVEAALRERDGVEDAVCTASDLECSCEAQLELQVQAGALERARDVFLTGAYCVTGQRMRLDDGSASLLLERTER